MTQDFDKEFFTRTWGPGGYYENFSYGVGINRVCDTCVKPFAIGNRVLEIGSGGGVFTNRITEWTGRLTCIDVIPRPDPFTPIAKYIELPNQDYFCTGVPDESIDFAFCYNVFCHLSNDAIRQYLQSVNRVLVPVGDFVFMLSSYGRGLPTVGDLLPVGHFAQDERTLDLVIGEGWEIVSRNMIPEHRDIIVHLKKQA
jgi:SAM-dependent methyltransferase